MGLNIKVNKVKCDIGSYIHYWRGIPKVGKTRLFYDLILEQYHDLSKGLLISIGNEMGVQALDGLYYVRAKEWSDIEDIVDELVENKSENNFELIGLDTTDELIKLAQKEVIRLHKKKKGTAADFNACFGGYGEPRRILTELIDNILSKLHDGGYGIIIIGHTKIRDVKEKNGDEYQKLTSNLSADYDNIFMSKADIAMIINVEKDIDENKRVTSSTRYMWFRNDGFIDAGGRFDTFPEKVEYGAKNYIKAVEEGIKGAIKDNISSSEIKKRAEKEKIEKNKEAEKYSKDLKENATNEDRNDELREIIKTRFPDASDKIKASVKEIMADYGFKKFSEESIPTVALEKIVALLG